MDYLNHTDHPQGLEELYKIALEVAGVTQQTAPFVDVGTRSGGSLLLQLKAVASSGKKDRWVFSIDPYGYKPYKDGNNVFLMDYGEHHRRNAMKMAADYAYDQELNHLHFQMMSTDFIETTPHKFLWENGEKIDPDKFAFVFLDGDHDQDTVLRELQYFLPRMVEGGVIVVDDVDHMVGHDDKIAPYLTLGTIQDRRLILETDNVSDELRHIDI